MHVKHQYAKVPDGRLSSLRMPVCAILDGQNPVSHVSGHGDSQALGFKAPNPMHAHNAQEAGRCALVLSGSQHDDTASMSTLPNQHSEESNGSMRHARKGPYLVQRSHLVQAMPQRSRCELSG